MKFRIFFLIFALSLLSLCLYGCSHEHIFGEWTVIEKADCTRDGMQKRICTECNYEELSKIDAPAHNLSATKTEPTCEAQGFTTYTCSCGYSYVSEHQSPIGHNFSKQVTEPTCQSQGFTHYSCKNCDYKFDGDFIAPLSHQGSQIEIFYPTVLRDGFSTHLCANCGYKYNDNYVSYKSILPSALTENREILKKGIDVSRYNHDFDGTSYKSIDWTLLKSAGVDFVIINAGDSINGIEPTFEMDYLGAKAAGLEVGAYFYTYSTTIENTLADANNLLEWLDGKQFEYPIYFDLEDDTLKNIEKSYLTKLCMTFADALQSHGYYCGLYLNNDWLFNILDTNTIKNNFDIWYARYPKEPSIIPEGYAYEWTAEPLVWDESKYGYQLGMWQYTQHGKIDGFDCYFDFNYSYKNYAEIMKAWKLNGFSDK